MYVEGAHLVDVLLVGLLAKRVAFINVGELLQHLADLLGKCGIGVCKADGNLRTRAMHDSGKHTSVVGDGTKKNLK